jgi:hypothetical protein
VFLSYSRGDRALAERVVRGLRHIGVDVWWDEDMPGVDWQEELARQIQQLTAVVVIWTPLSSASKNVRDEARLGQHTEKLVNALFGVAAPPFPFDRINGLPLDGWTDREPHGGWTRLVQTIEERLVAAGLAKPGELTSALAEREKTIRLRREELGAAEETFQAAKAGEEAAADAVAAAGAALETAEELLRLVVERRASDPVLRASQGDVETARNGLAGVTAQKTAAAATLAGASRGLARARAELEQLFDAEPPVGEPPAEAAATSAAPKRVATQPGAEATPPTTPPARAMPAWAPIAGVAALAVVGLALFFGLHPSAVKGASAVPAVPSAALDPTVGVERALVGDWGGGNGAACWSNPLRIAVDGMTLRETLSSTPSVGAVTGPEGNHAVRVKFPGDADPRGDQVYAVDGSKLTLTVSGDAMVYQRCPS